MALRVRRISFFGVSGFVIRVFGKLPLLKAPIACQLSETDFSKIRRESEARGITLHVRCAVLWAMAVLALNVRHLRDGRELRQDLAPVQRVAVREQAGVSERLVVLLLIEAVVYGGLVEADDVAGETGFR